MPEELGTIPVGAHADSVHFIVLKLADVESVIHVNVLANAFFFPKYKLAMVFIAVWVP